jgi:hypothetical protein
MTTKKPWQDKALLYQLYIIDKKTTTEIANVFQCTHKTITYWLNKFNIKIRHISECLKGKIKINPKTRFWNKVNKKDKNKCWEWQAGKSNRYGAFKINGRTIGAHIFSWEIHNGKIPDGLFVCHKCDNPGCVNPDHLFLGTNKDNCDDRDKKKRQAYGEKTECLNYPMSK